MDFTGIHSVENIKSDTLVTVLKGILIRLNIPLLICRGQCYYGDKTRCRNTNLVILTHCYGHALNLAVNDMIKEERLLKNTMATTSELSKLIKKSPKREGMLQKIRDDLSLECPHKMDCTCKHFKKHS